MWSTRQLAELANTTVQTIRHYHRMGVLDEPDRWDNNYKRYGTPHLVRLLQVLRLTELGLTLRQIRSLAAPDADREALLTNLAVQLDVEIEKLQRAREAVTGLMAHGHPVEVPSPFWEVAERLTPKDLMLVEVYAHCLELPELRDIVAAIMDPESESDDAFNALDETSSQEAFDLAASRLSRDLARHHTKYPWMKRLASVSPLEEETAETMIVDALVRAYNPIQLRCLAAASTLLEGSPPYGARTAIHRR